MPRDHRVPHLRRRWATRPNKRKRHRQRSLAHQHRISPIAATRNAGSRHFPFVRSEAAIIPSGPNRSKRTLPFSRWIAPVARSKGPIRPLTPSRQRFRQVPAQHQPLAHEGKFQNQGFAAERAFLVIRWSCEPTDSRSARHPACRFNIGNYGRLVERQNFTALTSPLLSGTWG